MFDALEFTKTLIKIPSISADSSRREDVAKCAAAYVAKLRELGFEAEAVKTELHPIVWATRKAKVPPKFRVLCYGHYDVQPVDPIEKWRTPPFEPIVKDGRLCGRGSADNKGPFMCLLGGLVKFLEKNPDAPIDFALMIEGEEEISSPSMGAFLRQKAAELAGYDVLLLSDTSSISEDQMVVTTGLRGVFAFDVNFTGPAGDLHSGMFGGAVYNPLQAMSEVCASLHDKEGFVNIEGFYEDVLPLADWERENIKKSNFGDESLCACAGVKKLYAQRGYTASEALRVLPTLEFTGMGGGYQGQGNKSIIPSTCFCKISIRLVPNQNGEKIYKLVKDAIIERTPPAVKVEVSPLDGVGEAYCVVPPDREGAPKPYPEKLAKVFRAAEQAVEKNFGNKPLYLREGGSIPLISDVKRITGLDSVMLGLFTPSDNLHAPNESFSLKIMERATNSYEQIFESLSK